MSAVCAGVTGAALAGPLDDPETASLAAGYKAAFTCSATFNAGRRPGEIAGDELARIYPSLRDALAALPPAAVDRAEKTVTVAHREGSPPRFAIWREHLGCTQLPSGASLAMAENLPNLDDLDAPAAPAPLPVATMRDKAAKKRLDSVVAKAFDRASYGEGTETSAVLVVRKGEIIAERYREGFGPNVSQRTWSVAKSIAASVLGAAVHRGLIDVDAPAGLRVWSAPGDPRASITLQNLLNMSSGLSWHTRGSITDDVYFGGGRVIDHAVTNRLVATPGTRWRYANNDTLSAVRALREAMGDDAAFRRFPFVALLHPVGMTNTYLETDWNGDFIMSSQVWTTSRDLARLGMLYLNDGVIGGQRLIPEGWADYVARPAPAQPVWGEGENGPGYGAQFWLFGPSQEFPVGTYAALGNRGQSLFILPSEQLLVIRRGFDEIAGERFDAPRFVAEVHAALKR